MDDTRGWMKRRGAAIPRCRYEWSEQYGAAMMLASTVVHDDCGGMSRYRMVQHTFGISN
jgi:hypothetical protein